MFSFILHFLSVNLTNHLSNESRIRKINMDIFQYENDFKINVRIIESLNLHRCCVNRHLSKKTQIDREINKLNTEKSGLQKYSKDEYFIKFGRYLDKDLSDIEKKIEQQKINWDAHVRLYNESIQNRNSYEKINDSLKKKIQMLESEKVALKLSMMGVS
ncbi:hypothetical protein EDEG_03473 [Edhazardia aedis USNM 41457]|uniref:Uncharacterized protein n=1 Tax=Edhazardia aedis (strain USNM 41457) TaxID=1003232 RepID=J9D2P8_EDHAE|nr:hypothetical protein EDEG_03473 [Edhazardia aedis USNM 41457]|eukprot:EJW02071.1 hypothetical protein EDEG_03473 [Edhazardia aedis USNM 41457]